MPSSSLEHSQTEQELSLLMRKSQAGDRPAYAELLGKVQEMLRPFIINSLRKLKRDAGPEVVHDLLQEALLGLHLKRATYDPEQYFLPWIYAIARYKTIDYFRYRKSTAHLTELSPILSATLAASENETVGAGVDARELLAALPEKQRRIFELVKIEGLSIQEAAAKTGYSTADIKVSIYRGLKFLQKRMQDERGVAREK